MQELDASNRFAIGESFLKLKEKNVDASTDPAASTETLATLPVQPTELLESTALQLENVLLSAPPPPPPPFSTDEFGSMQKATESDGDLQTNGDDPTWDPNAEEPITPNTPENKPVDVPERPSPVDETGKYCKICDISVTSEMHMRLHLTGAKHAKKLRQLGEPPYTESPDTLSQSLNNDRFFSKVYKNLLVDDGNGFKADYSVFRTPSGQYYCQVCDTTATSELMLSQHFGSKKHLKTAAAAKRK